MTLSMSELLRVDTPYEQFAKKFKEVVSSNKFTNDKVKIFTSDRWRKIILSRYKNANDS